MMSQSSEQIARQFANAEINRRTWGEIIYNVRSFGAVGNGVTDDTKSIIDTIKAIDDDGGILFFPPGTYRITSTIMLNKKIRIQGVGFDSIIISDANPIFTTVQDYSVKLVVSTIKIVTTSNNTGLFINKTWDAGAIASFEMDKVWFHAEGNAGSLLKIYGARESGIANCWFTSSMNWSNIGSAIGVELVGDASGGAMNIGWTGCQFQNLYCAVYGRGNQSRPDLFAGYRFVNCMLIGISKGFDFANGGAFTLADSMLDFVQYPIRLENWGGGGTIRGNYIGVRDIDKDAIILVPVGGHTYDNFIMDNTITTYDQQNASKTGKGIVLDGTLGGGHVIRTMVKNNLIQGFQMGVYVQGKDFVFPGYANEIHGNHFRYCNFGIRFDTYTVNNRAKDNYFSNDGVGGVVNAISDSGQRNIIYDNLWDEKKGRNSGVYETNSTQGTYTYSFPHGLYAIPKSAVVIPATTPTRDMGLYSISFDDTNISVNFANPTAAGQVISWSWMAEV